MSAWLRALLPEWQIAVTLAALAVAIYAVIATHRRLEAVAQEAPWNVSDLFCEDGRLSPRRLAHVIGIIAGTVSFLRLTWNAVIGDGAGVVLLFLTYCAVMMFPETAERIIGAKFGGETNNAATSAPKPGG